MSEENRLAAAITKNLEIIKKDTNISNEDINEKINNDDDEGDEDGQQDDKLVLGQLTRLSQPKGDFEFSANRLFFDDLYFRNSRLIQM